jgi:LmbE family N-acetylglucosaminyl deacetylase
VKLDSVAYARPVADVVVLAPHMDDETLGCGGVLALADDPLVIFGVYSRDEGIEVDEVAAILGYRYEVLYGAEWEARFLSIDRRELVGKIEAILHVERPSKVFLPAPSYHQDHTVLFEAGVAATRPLSREGYLARLVASYEYPGSAWRRDGREDQLSYYVDIEPVLDRKLAAVKAYNTSQKGRAVVDEEVVVSWSRLRGAFVGMDYAEAFHLFRYIEQSS